MVFVVTNIQRWGYCDVVVSGRMANSALSQSKRPARESQRIPLETQLSWTRTQKQNGGCVMVVVAIIY